MIEEPQFDEWEGSVGRMVLACSRVEYELLRLYEKWMPDRDFHQDGYIERYDKAIGVAKASLERGERITSLLIEMKNYAETRHMVAHNPVHYSAETDSWHIFNSKKQSKSVEIDDLYEEANNAYEVSLKLSILLRGKV